MTDRRQNETELGDLPVDEYYVEPYRTWFLAVDALLFPIIVLGNLLIVASVFSFSRMRTRSNALIVSLAFSDLFVGVVVLPYEFFYLSFRWMSQAELTCQLRSTFLVASLSLSLGNLLIISVERYVAVLHPFRYQSAMSWRTIGVLIAFVWVYITGWMMVPILGWNEWVPNVKCDIHYIWPKGFLYLLFLKGILVVTVASYCYAKVIKVAWRQIETVHRQGIAKRSQKNPAAELRNAKMMALVLVVFVVCWFPYLVMAFMRHLGYRSIFINLVKDFCVSLIMFNSCVNSAIYGWKNKGFRRAFKELLTCCKKDSTRRRVTVWSADP